MSKCPTCGTPNPVDKLQDELEEQRVEINNSVRTRKEAGVEITNLRNRLKYQLAIEKQLSEDNGRLREESFLSYVRKQKEWSIKIFGAGLRTLGISKHIRCELVEIEEQPEDLEEWIDVIQLAIDGAWRIGYSAQEVFDCMKSKLAINQNREWDVQKDESKPNFHKTP